MFYFSEDGKTLQIRNYSTAQEKYYGEQNQFTITIDAVSSVAGDVNTDGIVDVIDLVTVSNAVIRKDAEYSLGVLDINNDGFVDEKDMAEIRKLIIA